MRLYRDLLVKGRDPYLGLLKTERIDFIFPFSADSMRRARPCRSHGERHGHARASVDFGIDAGAKRSCEDRANLKARSATYILSHERRSRRKYRRSSLTRASFVNATSARNRPDIERSVAASICGCLASLARHGDVGLWSVSLPHGRLRTGVANHPRHRGRTPLFNNAPESRSG